MCVHVCVHECVCDVCVHIICSYTDMDISYIMYVLNMYLSMFLTDEKITSSILDPHGPFYVSNAFRELSPNATHNMLVTFSSSNRTEVFYEALTLFYGNGGSLRLGLKGQSFEPDVELSVKDESIDMGDIIVNDIINHSFQVKP